MARKRRIRDHFGSLFPTRLSEHAQGSGHAPASFGSLDSTVDQLNGHVPASRASRRAVRESVKYLAEGPHTGGPDEPDLDEADDEKDIQRLTRLWPDLDEKLKAQILALLPAADEDEAPEVEESRRSRQGAFPSFEESIRRLGG